MNRVSEPVFRSKKATALELNLCLSNSRKEIEKQKGYQGPNIEFSRVQLIFF